MVGRYEQLQAFVEVVDQQSFSVAAERLGVVKSVLSRRVSHLEARLGVKLLNRTTRKLSLTSAGEQLYQQASVLLVDLLEAEQKISEERVSLSGRLKIAAPLSFGVLQLSSAIAEFIDEHPEIDISLDLNDREIDPVAEGFDLTIRIGELKDSTLIARKLGVIRFVTVASPAYLQAHGIPSHPSELAAHDGLYYSNVSDKGQWSYVEGKQTLVTLPRHRLTANNGDFLTRAAMSGLGITQCPTFLVHDDIRAGRLNVILREYHSKGVGLYALFAPGRLIPRRSKELVDFLQQQYGDSPLWDQKI